MAIPATLTDAILHVAPRAQIELKLVNGHFSGSVIAPEFEHLTHLQRQQAVWHQINEDMGAESQQVGTLLLFTPDEADAIDDGADEQD